MSHTVHLTPEQAHAISLVGNVVTHGDNQYTVHSIEGDTWYAYTPNGGVSLDLGLTALSDFTPRATLLPMGARLGQGVTREIPVTAVRRGVCLAKSYR